MDFPNAEEAHPYLPRARPVRGFRLALIGLAVTALLGDSVVALVDRGPPTLAKRPELPADVPFDYQIGGDYVPADGVAVVSRDWFAGAPLTSDGTFSICYVNAFQTQEDEVGVARPDERSAWPRELVLDALGDDPEWGGEYLVDISTAARRRQASTWVQQMVDTCANKGFDAVEYDNLDSWTRFDGTPVDGQVPFGRAEAVAYAELLTDLAHGRGLAVGQKNTPSLGRATSVDEIGFDFAVAEQCGEYDECTAYTDVFGDQVVVVEYTDAGFQRACASVGAQVAVSRRDLGVSPADSPEHRFESC